MAKWVISFSKEIPGKTWKWFHHWFKTHKNTKSTSPNMKGKTNELKRTIVASQPAITQDKNHKQRRAFKQLHRFQGRLTQQNWQALSNQQLQLRRLLGSNTMLLWLVNIPQDINMNSFQHKVNAIASRKQTIEHVKIRQNTREALLNCRDFKANCSSVRRFEGKVTELDRR